jgi:cysteine desulfurase/selenocysteine lyase
MTTNMNTGSNTQPPGESGAVPTTSVGTEPEWEGVPAEPVAPIDPAVLAKLANEIFAAPPGGTLGSGSLNPGGPPVSGAGGSTEAQFDALPATIAGATGLSPQALATPSTPESAESLAYFLQSAQPVSSRTAPALNLESSGGTPASAATFAAGVPFMPELPVIPIVDPASASSLSFARGYGAPSPASGMPNGSLPGLPGGSTLGRGAVPTNTASATPAHIPSEVPGASYYFLDEGRSFGRTPFVSVVERKETRPEAVPDPDSSHPAFDVHAVRRDFPILQERVHGRPLIWLDNAATTQKPQSVIDRLAYFYQHENSNIHRAAHELAARATDAYEAARDKVARFLHASSSDEIVFVRGTTEAINLVAQSWGRRHIGPGDEIVITWLEHHANIVPWQQLAAEKGARLRVAPVDDRGQVRLDEFEKLLGPRTRLVAFSQVSNALGTITPAREMVEIAHRYGARVLVDGAQAVSHMRVDVQELDADWYVFSGHKVFGPTGIGALYGKLDLLNAMPVWQGGGNMIQDVTFERTVYQRAPARFEAGTGNIADAVGLGAALDYVEKIGMDNVSCYEHELLVYATRGLSTIPGLRLIGTAPEKAGVLSFVIDGFRTEDIGHVLNQEGIAVRTGHHCAQPILRRFGLETTVRPSLAFYNTCEEIDVLVDTLRQIRSGRYGLQH